MSRALSRAAYLVPVFLLLLVGVAVAQVAPPSAWHPYRCAAGVAQVVDANGNFSCSGKLLMKQSTPSTCAVVGGHNETVSGSCVMDVAGDTAMRARLSNNADQQGSKTGSLRITFGATWPSTPACVASLNWGAATYAYYLYGVTPTTTSVTLKLASPHNNGVKRFAVWPAQTSVNVICAGAR